jgi:hypothetical protein
VVQFVLLAYASTTDVEHIRTVVLDQDRSADSRALVQAYQAAGYFDVVGRAEAPSGIVRQLDGGTAVLGLIIPPGFSRELRSGKGATVQALIDGSDASVATVAQSYVAQVAERFGAKARPTLHRPAGIELLAACRTVPFSTRQLSGFTPQRLAAAATSISRAAAPATRHGCQLSSTLPLPAVWSSMPVNGPPGQACSTFTRVQSQPSSSATSIGSTVRTPCPISSFVAHTVTLPSGAMRR